MGQHTNHRLLLGGATATAAVIAAPYVLPALKVGPADFSDQILGFCGHNPGGTGLAATLNHALTGIPFIGKFLEAGTWSSALISGGLGIGGLLLGNYVHKHYDKPGTVQWGKIIKYAALTTSLLIALPSLLTGITMGLTFLAFAIKPGLGTSVYNTLGSSLGLIGNMDKVVAGAGLTSLMPHFLTCGVAATPALGSLVFSGNPKKHDAPTPWTERIRQPMIDFPPLPAR